MREYTFLMSKSWRTKHVQANNLRQAWRKTREWYNNLSIQDKLHYGQLTNLYQTSGINDYVMSGWLHTNDKQIKI